MTRILHLSDLHFGRDRPELLTPLVDAVNGLSPDLVAISGDLTQRARSRQFAAARAFIDRIRAPVLCVPGNHDISLHNPVRRVLRPFSRYRQWISRDLEPKYQDDGMFVMGLNSVDRFAWQRGRFRAASLRRACQEFKAADPCLLRVLVIHHPLEHLPGQPKQLMIGAERAAAALTECGVDLILSGHLHLNRAGPFHGSTTIPVQIHAGTGLSTRVRGESNDFNMIEASSGLVTVTRHAADEDAKAFSPVSHLRFTARPEMGRRRSHLT